MDRELEKKKGLKAVFRKKNIPYFAGALFLVFVLWLIFRDNSSAYRADKDMLNIVEVQLQRRLANDTARPLLKKPNRNAVIEELLGQRLPLYRSAADFAVDAGAAPAEVVRSILAALGEGG